MITLEIRPDARPGLALMHLAFRPPRVDEDAARYLAALERIGAQEAPFLLLLDLAGAGMAPPELRRQEARWLKKNRDGLRARLCAAAVVMSRPTPRAEQSFARLFDAPVLLSDSRAAALSFLLSPTVETEARP
ncbi:hypothetical protein [Pseudooceanicola marinus]|uniref:hypothetical protein n=1 Tax=Pseudooceanicola marinus TaxID=396013 RepID=UPI001CD51882|nr:hypothetical protein [Pseudooceanicola marinus]MCA1334550.1 hypothetical protein [Pseudooceanicola marinus]